MSMFVKKILQRDIAVHDWHLKLIPQFAWAASSALLFFPCASINPSCSGHFCTDHTGWNCSKPSEFISCFYEINVIYLHVLSKCVFFYLSSTNRHHCSSKQKTFGWFNTLSKCYRQSSSQLRSFQSLSLWAGLSCRAVRCDPQALAWSGGWVPGIIQQREEKSPLNYQKEYNELVPRVSLRLSPAPATRLRRPGHKWCVPQSACSAPRSCRSQKWPPLRGRTSTSSCPSSRPLIKIWWQSCYIVHFQVLFCSASHNQKLTPSSKTLININQYIYILLQKHCFSFLLQLMLCWTCPVFGRRSQRGGQLAHVLFNCNTQLFLKRYFLAKTICRANSQQQQFPTLPAGGALATALVFVELHQACDGSNHISLERQNLLDVALWTHSCTLTKLAHRFIHHDDGSRPQCSLCTDEVIKVHQNLVTHVPRDDGGGRPTRDHS